MVYLIGGASRVGKSTLANLLLQRRRISFLSADALVHTLKNVAPELGVTGNGPLPEKAAKFYPYLKGFIKYNSFSIKDFIIEGDVILPYHSAELSQEFPVKSCFLGFSEIAIGALKENAGSNNWIDNLTEGSLKALPEEIIKISKFIKTECEKYSLKYFDLSGKYKERLEEAYTFLL